MKTIADIRYGEHPMQLIDLYLPDGEVKAVYIYLHGGGLVHGSRRIDSEGGIPRQFTAQGIAVASVEYRMMPDFHYPVFVEDSALACAYVKKTLEKEYGFPGRTVIGGSSAGGYLTMMLALDRHFLADVGMTPEDFDGFIFDDGQPTTHFAVLSERGFDAKRVIIDETAPLYHVQDARPGKPVLVFTAEFDMENRVEQNQLLIRAMKNFGYPEELIEYHHMLGYKHCGYINAGPSGSNFYGEKCIAFIHGK